MKLHRTIAAGTALALLMTAPFYTGSLSAAPLNSGVPAIPQSLNNAPPVILAQVTIEELRLRLEQEDLTDEERSVIEQQIQALEDAAEAEEPAPTEEAPVAEEPAAEEPAAEEEPVTEEPAAEEPAAEEEPTAEEPAAEDVPVVEEPVVEEPAEEEAVPVEEEPAADEPAAEEPAAEEPVTEEPAADEPAAEEETVTEDPAAEEPTAEEPTSEEEAPVEDDAAAAEETGEAAPILDSQKETEISGEAEASGEADATVEAEAEQAPPPESDEDAQAEAVPESSEVESATTAEGTRIEESQVQSSVEQHSGAEIIGEIAGRLILSLAGRQVIRYDDRDRIRHGADEFYFEELRWGRTRETIVRADGTRIVTIRDRYGDIIQRSRITPDGREYILVYAGDRDGDDSRDRWRDPGRDLPPLRLRIPVDEYILDARRVEDPDRYYRFLDHPPVEKVRRLYSIDEVKYSARIRDSMRRIDLDNITFEFGSAAISQSEVAKLEGLANAMARQLDENPAETFLIEGHTDAVGTENANLALSDRRADSVAQALTDVFGIPPENLVTQGYGEAYLKVNTEEPNRTNRRVAVRRITPLVAPVASR